MSAIAPPQAEETYQCNHCGGHAPAHSFYDEAMCSRECRAQADATSTLNELHTNHCVCATCYRRQKTILKATDSTPDVFQGLQFRTEHADWGEKSPDRDEKRLRIPSKDRQIYAYEVPESDDGDVEMVEYYPARKFDHVHDNQRDPRLDPSDWQVRTGTVCNVCGQTDHRDVDLTLRKECSRSLVGHHFTERLRELRVRYDESAFWDAYMGEAKDIRTAFEKSIRL